MDLGSLSRRSFIGKMASAATVVATPLVALPVVNAQAAETAVAATTLSRLERLNALFADLRQLVATEFPEFNVWGDILPDHLPAKSGALHVAFFATCPPPPEPTGIEFNGPGIYEISLTAWRDTDRRVQRLERAPKGHRYAGQFRFRFPRAPAHSGWKYAPESEFRLIRPAL